jgi:hypothetical protein
MEESINQVEVELAMQCAPLITGMKISNLFSIGLDAYKAMYDILENSGISVYQMGLLDGRVLFLLYQENQLTSYLSRKDVAELLTRFGYDNVTPDCILDTCCRRYQKYMLEKKDFPHELGLILGYPPEDVEGFVSQQGKNSLYTGYWKVYKDPEAKKALFDRFEYAKESLIHLLSCGIGMKEIISVCS